MLATACETVSVERRASSLVPLDTLGVTIKVQIAKGDKAADKAEEHYISAGLRLAEAKERIAHIKGQTWAVFLRKHCQINRRRADELISIAEGRTSLAELRAAKLKSVRATRERDSALRSAQSSQVPEQDQQGEKSKTDDRSKQRNIVTLAMRDLDLADLTLLAKYATELRSGQDN